MKPAAFDYHRVDTADEAIERLAELGDEAKVLAGGQSLVPMMNFRLVRPPALVDVSRVAELRGLRREDGALRIGALTRHAEVEHAAADDLAGGFEILRRAARFVGHFPIRARGTFGGSVAHADPAAEWCMLAVALDAEIVVRGPDGRAHGPGAGVLRRLLHDHARARRDRRGGALPPSAGATRRSRSSPAATATSRSSPRSSRSTRSDGVVRDARVVVGGVDEVPVARRGRRGRAARPRLGRVRGRRQGRRRRGRSLRRHPRQRGVPARADRRARAPRARRGPRCRLRATIGPDPKWVGQPIRRLEDPRHLRGTATFVDDLRPAGLRHAVFVRSPYAAARVTGIDTGRALACDGVHAVLTAADLGELRPWRPQLHRDGFRVVDVPALADGVVRHVGDPVAIVVADSPHSAEDGAERVDVDYEPLDAVASIDAALAGDAPRVHDGLDGNLLLDEQFAEDDAVAGELERADARGGGDLHLRAAERAPARGARLPRGVGARHRAPRAAHLDPGSAHRPHDGRRAARDARAPRARRRPRRRRRIRPEVRRRPRGGRAVRRRARHALGAEVVRGPPGEPQRRLPGPRAALRRARRLRGRRPPGRARRRAPVPTSAPTTATRSPPASRR